MATKSRTRATSATRTSRASRQRTESLTLRCRINGLPIKAILYALLYINSKNDAHRKSSSTASLKARESIRVLRAVNNKLRQSEPLDAIEMHDILDITTSSYVNLYYSLDSTVRHAILSDNHRKIPNEENILTMPALMIKNNVPKSSVIASVKRSLYKKPLQFLQSSLVASRKMESLRASMSLKKSTDFTSDRLSYSLQTVENMIDTIDHGVIRPAEDEDLKDKVITDLVGLSERYDAHTLSYIKSKLDQTSFNITTAQRVIRE